MRRLCAALLCLPLAISCWANVKPSKAELRNRKRAQKDVEQAVALMRTGDTAHAADLLDEAISLDKTNSAALTTRELIKQHEIQAKLTAANRLLTENKRDQALASAREAVKLDPKNAIAAQTLKAALGGEPFQASKPPLKYRDAEEVQLAPAEAPQDFHFKGDSRGLIERVWAAYSVHPLLDSSVASKPVRFDIEQVDFATATLLVSEMTKTFFVPLSPTQALVLADTPENRKNFERLALRTFYIGEASSANDINEVVTLLRSVFDFRFVTPAANSKEVTVRAPIETLNAATRILEDLYAGAPQIMLEVNVYQIDQTLARDLGIGFPTQFNLFNVNTEIAKLTGSNQNLINQLISSGQINQGSASSIAALLAGLAASGNQNSIVNQPLATFGGGLTRSGVIIPGTSIHNSLNKGSLQTLDHVMLRASQADPATFRDGTRYPILNASYAPLSNSSAISQVLGNQSYQAPFPSFSYEDLGLSLKATPTIHGTRDVGLKLEFQLRGLGAQTLNAVPVLTNREYAGTIDVPVGATAVLAGMVTQSEQLTLQGLPGISKLLGLGSSVQNKQLEDAELLITVTPHLVRESFHNPSQGVAFLPPPTAQ